jgi:hypothetical protein
MGSIFEIEPILTKQMARRRNSFATLQKLAQQPSREKPAVETCELCRVSITPWHRHLLEVAKRQIVCACDACALRFQDVVGGSYKLIPRDVHTLPDFHLSDAQWDGLAVPINLAFFFYSTPAARLVAMYPSPAGATESLLPLDTWETLVAENSRLNQMEPDVEALLVNRVGAEQAYYLAPIDTCYRLVGLIRMHWRGLSGGDKVWQEIGQFFDDLKRKALSKSHSS